MDQNKKKFTIFYDISSPKTTTHPLACKKVSGVCGESAVLEILEKIKQDWHVSRHDIAYEFNTQQWRINPENLIFVF